jgi:hypothetical protein
MEHLLLGHLVKGTGDVGRGQLGDVGADLPLDHVGIGRAAALVVS